MYAITGINYEEIRDLLRHGMKTFELVSADHLKIARKLKLKEKFFIGNMSKQDVKKGVEGVLAEVKDVKIGYWRIFPREFDEKEVLTARIQAKYISNCRVIKTQDLGVGEGLEVNVEPHILLG